MNVQISTFVDFSGPLEELDPLLNAITDAVVECGYGSEDSEDGALNSLVTVTPSALEEYESPLAFAKSLLGQAAIIIIPMANTEEENNERTGD